MRRTALALLVAAALAGCVESDPSTVEGPPGSPATTVVPAPGAPGATSAPPPRGTIIVGGTDAVPETTVAPRGASKPADRGPGSFAGWFLRPGGAERLVIQVLTQDGAEPRQATLDRLTSVLREVSGKEVTTAGGANPPGREVWSGAALREAADAAAFRVADGTAVIRLLFVHGRSDQGDGVLGVATGGDVAAVFGDRVDDAATGLVSPASIERAIAVHELGHLLGLVDLVLATGREDPEHPGHSTNRRSVMYWAVESSLVGDLLSGGPPQDFDDADRADLAAIRGG